MKIIACNSNRPLSEAIAAYLNLPLTEAAELLCVQRLATTHLPQSHATWKKQERHQQAFNARAKSKSRTTL